MYFQSYLRLLNRWSLSIGLVPLHIPKQQDLGRGLQVRKILGVLKLHLRCGGRREKSIFFTAQECAMSEPWRQTRPCGASPLCHAALRGNTPTPLGSQECLPNRAHLNTMKYKYLIAVLTGNEQPRQKVLEKYKKMLGLTLKSKFFTYVQSPNRQHAGRESDASLFSLGKKAKLSQLRGGLVFPIPWIRTLP